jgi:thiopurine S-methyltransferase
MQPEFWEERWREGRIGFHRPTVDENLARFWPALEAPPAGRVFVPLCGKSRDLLWLRERGYTVVGVELSQIALEAFCMENGIPARRRRLADFERYEAPGLELYRGDFFALTPSLLGHPVAVFDRAALVAWPPELRLQYARQLTALTPPGAPTLLITLEYPQDLMTGPPFSVDAAEVERLYSPHHAIRELARRDVLASEPRMRERGITELIEVCHRLVRKSDEP